MITRDDFKALLANLGITKNTSRRQVREMLTNKGYSEPEYRVHDGASKLCIVPKHADFVIKWSTTCLTVGDYDEAYDEVLIYQKAIKAGLEMFFPKTEVLCIVNGVIFVVQEKIDFSVLNTPSSKENKYEYKTRTASRVIIDKMDTCFCSIARGRDLDETWASMAIVVYGKKKCKALCKFVIENGINDLHRSNIGYLKDKPIILDFSGYHRN
ncbi:hypothetical protein [Treponema sp.]|uniref:hypothetical protein n=1 Tax=Treponema sp. TaxID=166 RepID=UPI003F10A4BF